MLNPNDKMIKVHLYSSHICDFLYEREDGSHYVHMKRETESFVELLPNPTGETRWVHGETIKVIKK